MPRDAGPQRPVAVVRAGTGPWGPRLAIAATAMVTASAAIVAESVPAGIPSSIVIAIDLAAFALLAASVMQITARWRTSLRSDGGSLVVRAPFAVAVHSFDHDLAIWRWVDERRRRPEHWVIESGRIATPVGDAIDPVGIEAFAQLIGVPLVDLEGPPPSDGAR